MNLRQSYYWRNYHLILYYNFNIIIIIKFIKELWKVKV
jgi:hypothetical protein